MRCVDIVGGRQMDGHTFCMCFPSVSSKIDSLVNIFENFFNRQGRHRVVSGIIHSCRISSRPLLAEAQLV